MARRKINSTAPPDNEAAQLLVPTEPSVPGVKLELGILLIQAIKARRKLLSKTSSLSSSTADDGNNNIQSRELLQTLQDNVSDKTTAFLNELKRSAQNKSSWSSSASSVSYKRTNSTTTHAPVRCFEFLLDILSNNDGTNTSSFHLRRSALAISHEILTRSRDARSFFARGQCLLDFVRMIEGVEYEQVMAVVGEDEKGRDDNDGGRSRGQLSPRALFQLEAIELIHDMSTKYGNLYTEFMVASRLLGDVSTNLTMQHHHYNIRHEDRGNAAPENAEPGMVSSQQQQHVNNNARTLRNERNNALEYGPRACQILERMIERADIYFRILVPRFGGFNTSIESIHKRDTGNDDDDDDDVDDGSIDWEEGDVELLIDDAEHNIVGINNDHQAAVSHTLAVMEKTGALLEGALAIQVHGDKSEADVNLPATGQDHVPDDVSARKKLQNLVVKLSHRLSRMNQWIFALSYADGMDERTVIDPITPRPLISLVLLSEEKRAVRSMILQRMMKVRGEIECVLHSASKLGIVQKESRSEVKIRAIEREGISAAVNRIANDTLAGIKRPSLPPLSKRKRTKIPRINVIYRKK